MNNNNIEINIHNNADQTFQEVFPFWNTLTASDKNYIYDHTFYTSYQKGTTLYDGNECSGVFVLQSGTLRVYVLSEEGKEITLYRLHKGEMCMLSASCVIQSITFDVMIDAEDDCQCFIISASAFANISEKNPQVKIFALETAVSRFSDVMWVLQQVLFMSMDKRLAIFLYEESVRLQTDTLTYTQDQIAKHLGSAREVISRMLKYFSNEGIVEVSRKGVRILDKNKLRILTQN